MGIGLTALDGIRDGMNSASVYPDYVTQRISVTYGYVVAGLGFTAASALGIVRSGAHHRYIYIYICVYIWICICIYDMYVYLFVLRFCR